MIKDWTPRQDSRGNREESSINCKKVWSLAKWRTQVLSYEIRDASKKQIQKHKISRWRRETWNWNCHSPGAMKQITKLLTVVDGCWFCLVAEINEYGHNKHLIDNRMCTRWTEFTVYWVNNILLFYWWLQRIDFWLYKLESLGTNFNIEAKI